MPRPLSPDEIDAFRADLCRVAERLFAERGFEGVTLRALATELGCSPMTPYRYFENKEAILAEVRGAAFARHGVRCEKVASEYRDPVERFKALGRQYIAFALEEPHAYRTMFALTEQTNLGDLIRDPDRRSDVLRGWTPLIDVLTELIETGRAYGDPVELAHLCWVTLHGLVSLELSQRFLLGRSLDDLVEPAFELFLRGIGAPPNSSESGVHDAEPSPPGSP